ncbi:MAG: hypothetical protein ACE5KL_08290, partial [Alphaproteobacteria bacterium]
MKPGIRHGVADGWFVADIAGSEATFSGSKPKKRQVSAMCPGRGAVTASSPPAGCGIAIERAWRWSFRLKPCPARKAPLAPYLPSPKIGVPRAAQWARSWCVRPVQRHQPNPRRLRPGRFHHLVERDRPFALFRIRRHALARPAGQFGEAEIDAAPARLGHADDHGPVNLARAS